MPGPRSPDGISTKGHVKQLLLLVVPIGFLNATVGFAVLFRKMDSSLAAHDAAFVAMALGVYTVAALPYLATSLMMRVQLEALSLHLKGELTASNSKNCRELVVGVEEKVDEIRSEWKTFLIWHFVFGGASIVASLLFELASIIKKVPAGADIAAGSQIIHHPIMSVAFLVVQVLAVADYNEEVLQLRATTDDHSDTPFDSNTAYRVLGQHLDKLLISVCGLVITHRKLRTVMVSIGLSWAAKFVVPMIIGWIG